MDLQAMDLFVPPVQAVRLLFLAKWTSVPIGKVDCLFPPPIRLFLPSEWSGVSQAVQSMDP